MEHMALILQQMRKDNTLETVLAGKRGKKQKDADGKSSGGIRENTIARFVETCVCISLRILKV